MKAITLKNVSKKYFLAPGRAILLRDIFLPPKKKVVLALKKVSLAIEKGQSVGIIGENGSGKSTLLKVIAGITHATSGRIQVEGTVGSIIELGAGFHPDLSGKENAFLGGALMGFSKGELDEKYPQILEFSGLSEFIDQPIRAYSSGMVVRLAFSIAIALDPDILLIDEVLAVGDEAFQKKCIEAIQNFKKNNKTILFVSHDLSLVYHVCPLCIWMHKGNLMLYGKTPKVIAEYTRSLPKGASGILAQGRWGNQDARITEVTLINNRGQKTNFFNEEQGMKIVLKIKFFKKVEYPVFGLTIKNEAGKNFFQTNTIWKQIKTGVFKNGSTQKVEFVFAENFPEGKYYVSPAVAESNLKKFYDWRENFLSFEVVRKRFSGTLAPKHVIRV